MIRTLLLAASLLAAAAASPARAAEPAHGASANLAELFSDEDYPAAAVRAHEEGTVAFRIAVAADGAPTGCTVTASSGSATLDATTCRLLMERARFTPARDAAGKAVTDTVSARIVWRLPEEEPPSRDQIFLGLWSACVLGEAAKLTITDVPRADFAQRSFGPCEGLEAVAVREVKDGQSPDQRRAELEEAIEAMIVAARTALLGNEKAGGAKAGDGPKRR